MIKIKSNNSIPMEALELFGYSTKRNKSNTIGQKGTGLKFTMALALRNDLEMVVATDEYIAHILKEEIDGIDEDRIIIKYKFKGKFSWDKIHKTSLTTGAGQDDWDDEWFIIRELLQNAYDEDSTRALNFTDILPKVQSYLSMEQDVDINSIDFSESNTTSYYIVGHNSRLNEVANNLNEFFSGEPLGESSAGSWYEKQSDGKGRIFVKGILVGTMRREYDFDYSFNDLELSESRTIKYTWAVENEISRINGSNEELEKISLDRMLEDPYSYTLDDDDFSRLYKKYYAGFKPKVVVENNTYISNHNNNVETHQNVAMSLSAQSKLIEYGAIEKTTRQKQEESSDKSDGIRKILFDMNKKQKANSKFSLKYLLAEEIWKLKNK